MEPWLRGCQLKDLFLIAYTCRLHHDAFFFSKRIFSRFLFNYTWKHLSYMETFIIGGSIKATNEKQESGVNRYEMIASIRAVQLLRCVRLCDTRPPCPSPTPGVHSNSCPSSRWCHPSISSSVVPFSSCLQSFPASGSLLMSQFFVSGGQSIGASASASVLPMNIQDWFPKGLKSFRIPFRIPLQSKGLSRVFSNTSVQKYQFFSAQLSL